MEARKGFTLIELLVVMAIIALLLAILFPSLQRARNNARAVVCQSNLKRWGTFFAMYADDNNGRFLCNRWGNVYQLNDAKYGNTGFDRRNIHLCPMADRMSDRAFTGNLVRGMEGSKFENGSLSLDPNDALGSTFEAWRVGHECGSFGINFTLTDFGHAIVTGSSRPARSQGVDIHFLKGQSNIPVLLDSKSPDSIFLWEGQTPPPTQEEETGCCINRHDGAVNSLFLDWSVRKVGLKELWKLKWHDEFDTAGPWTLAGGVKPEDWPEWMRGFKDY